MVEILVIPCSGIGKSVGSIGRDATFRVVDDLRRGRADTVCLSLLVAGDPGTENRVRNAKCIAVDGCTLECSKTLIEHAGGAVVKHVSVLDTLRENRAVKTSAVTFLDENGGKLAQALAEKLSAEVDAMEGEA
jgi:uncharacterized metal-binding protein